MTNISRGTDGFSYSMCVCVVGGWGWGLVQEEDKAQRWGTQKCENTMILHDIKNAGKGNVTGGSVGLV